MSSLRDAFYQNGYLVLDDFVNKHQLDLYSNELINVLNIAKKVPRKKSLGNVYWEDNPESIFLVGDLSIYSSFWGSLSNFLPFMNFAKILFETKEFEVEFIQAFIKHPNSKRKVSFHRDLANKAIVRENSNCFRLCLCLDAQTEENGGIQVIEQSHLVSDEEVNQETPEFRRSWKSLDNRNLITPAGSLIALHSKIIHGGGENKSNFPRRVVTFSFSHLSNQLIAPSISYPLIGKQIPFKS